MIFLILYMAWTTRFAFLRSRPAIRRTEFLLQPAVRALRATICQQRKLKAFRDWLLAEISHS